MVPRCTVCQHERRQEVKAALAAGRDSIRAVARQFGLHKDSLIRHKLAHVSPALVRVAQRRDQRDAERGPIRVLDRVERLTDRLEAMFEESDQSGARGQMVAVSRELRAALELLAKLRGGLREGHNVQVLNVMASPELQHVITVMLDELYDQPDVRMRIGARLKAMDAEKVLALPR